VSAMFADSNDESNHDASVRKRKSSRGMFNNGTWTGLWRKDRKKMMAMLKPHAYTCLFLRQQTRQWSVDNQICCRTQTVNVDCIQKVGVR
jgi:hypothetical protein